MLRQGGMELMALGLQLGLTSAPTLQLFKPTTGPRKSTKIGFESFDFGKR